MRPGCNYSDPEVIESLFVELDNPFGKNIVVGVVYRPPNQNISAQGYQETGYFPLKLSKCLMNSVLNGEKKISDRKSVV